MKNEISSIDLGEIVRQHYMDYAMSVIKDRALPDVMDGLKPVQRRILYDCYVLGITHDKPYKKCARVVGDVLGKFHPHGDTSVYECAVNMAQDFSYRYPYIDGHGNFGSIDGDSAAAMRYTEMRLSKYGEAVLGDVKKNTVEMIPNFDGEETEPKVLAGLVPNLLLNGNSGIAVGMATNMLPHNINDVYDAIKYVIDCKINNKEPNIDEIIKLIKAPDFPTGGYILKDKCIEEYYKTGTGYVINRGIYYYEESSNSIVITSLPYKVLKSKFIASIQKLQENSKIAGKTPSLPNIKDIRDESDRTGIRIVIELKKDTNPQIIINRMLKYTDLQCKQNACNRVLYDGKPLVLNIQELIEMFIYHASDVVYRKVVYDSEKLYTRYNNIYALMICSNKDNFNNVINIIKTSENPVNELMNQYQLDETQANYICDTKLRTLSNKSMDKLVEEAESIQKTYEYYQKIVSDENELLAYLVHLFDEILNEFGDKRRTEIIIDNNNIDDEDLVKDEDLVITITDKSIIKSVSASDFNKQGRGGKGSKGADIKDDENVEYTLFANSKDYLMFFTNLGYVHILKAYKIPKTSKNAKGKSVFNYLNINLANNEKIINVFADSLDDPAKTILMATKEGYLKRLDISLLSTIRSMTKIITFKNEDTLSSVAIVKDNDDVIINTFKGFSLRTKINDDNVRCMGRTASGVAGIKLKSKGDYVVSMNLCDKEYLFTLTENGLGKKTALSVFKIQNRGGVGVAAHKITTKTGNVVGAAIINDNDDILITTQNGLSIRITAKDISTCGRTTSGVKIVSLNENDKIADMIVLSSGEKQNKEA